MLETIYFFGAMRDYGESIDLPIPIGSKLPKIRQMIKTALEEKYPDRFDQQLFVTAALAKNDTIMHDSDSYAKGDTLSLLPPVCGG